MPKLELRAKRCAGANLVQGGIHHVALGCDFLVIALVAAVFGFTGIATAAAGIAKFLFFLFLIVCIVLFIAGFALAKKL
jgi:uncharacterized membrane protein YtjA (UPF0391 family)